MAGYIAVGVYDEDTISLELWYFYYVEELPLSARRSLLADDDLADIA